MKIQELAIIFIIIILPISLLLSEYTQFQIKTLNTQTIYDAKLTAATYDAIKAFQLNTSNESYSNIETEELRDLEASVESFKNSIKSAFKLTGYTDEDLNNYIPALVYTLYDGFYIYSPYENTYDEDGNRISGDTDSMYGLKPYINYSCRYQTTGLDVVITYALDNYVTVQGTINNEYVNKSGYLIDNITVTDDTVKYNGVTIGTEQLMENIGDSTYKYARINGTKYYLIEGDNEGDDKIVYISNGVITVQYKEGDPCFISYRNLILNNDNAKQYYKDAKEFTDWFKSTDLKKLKYRDAQDEVIDENGDISLDKVWDQDGVIFEFNESNTDFSKNIENELSNFNQHRLAVIRHKIETNLAIAISNYNSYSDADNVFQMPELKEDEWDHITHKISLISFLQGLPIGGKIYNGYSLVTNSETHEVVLEDNIYILGKDADNNKAYYRIGDAGFEDGTVKIDSGDYGDIQSAGRLNLDFERMTLSDNESQGYYYPLKSYDASYNSIVMQNNVTTYDDIYVYVNEQSDELKTAFYTALGRERYGMYKPDNSINFYNVLIIGHTVEGRDGKSRLKNIANILDKEDEFKVDYVYSNNPNNLSIDDIEKQIDNYNLIIVDSYAWPIGNKLIDLLKQVAGKTNIITISNDGTGLPMMKSSISSNEQPINVKPVMTDSGKNRFGDIDLNKRSDMQSVIKFNDDVDVLYEGEYTGAIEGTYDYIGCWKNGKYKWIHSQLDFRPDNANDMKLLKLLVSYAIN